MRNVRNLHQLQINGGESSSQMQMDIINRNASNSNIIYYTHPHNDDLLEGSFYQSEDVYGVRSHQQQQQHQQHMLQQQQQPRSSSLRQSQSRSGSQRNLSQLNQQEHQNSRVSFEVKVFGNILCKCLFRKFLNYYLNPEPKYSTFP